MRAVLQRVTRASVTINQTGERRDIGPGLMVLLGVRVGDAEADSLRLAEKVVGMRLFTDADGKMNLCLMDLPGPAMLIVSQFTLYGNTRKGRRPSFIDAAPPDLAIPLYELFVATVRSLGVDVKTGEFGAEMLVEIANDGPVTLIVDYPPLER